MEETIRDIPNKTTEEATQIKPETDNKSGATPESNESTESGKTEEKIEIKTEDGNASQSESKTETKKPEKVTIDIKPEPEATPSTSNNRPNILNEINLYDEEPSLRDVPLDIYDDTIKLEPQNPKNVNYHSIDEQEIENGNINNINLYESTPETKKTFLRKLKEIYMETVRLIKVCIQSIFSFIWAIIGGTITGIFTFFRNLFFNTLLAFIKFVIRSKKNNNNTNGSSSSSRGGDTTIVNGIINPNNDLWDINSMLITKPLYNMV
ncbi:hypothetical protein LY90DRAFT_499138 [Neocallimastix californiae]|uniref:Uncharacterized protein n=1 Tax=Neocallimastix californiae TaxID=1754190 RepID=A0A1Y2FMN5_9FUNG|nr:hypothetical protein LY90DRAFT_499138 [Neocallimastix californiae]|eukprot:ORY85208.1 hypothetical protein LY90DRAFT_499138 [Neocallimastix californiae]